MWTLILTLTIIGHSVHSITVPNLPSKEICKQTAETHIEQFNKSSKRYTISSGYIGVYTCLEQKQ